MLRDDELPPLPEPHKPAVYATAENTFSVRNGFELGGYEKEPPLYSEDQMREYARAVEAAAYAKAAQACRATPDRSGVNDDGRTWLVRATKYDCAAAIEALAQAKEATR